MGIFARWHLYRWKHRKASSGRHLTSRLLYCCQEFPLKFTKNLIRKCRFLMFANDMKIAIPSQSTHRKIRQLAQRSKSKKRSTIIHIFIHLLSYHQLPHQLSYHDSNLFHANSPFIAVRCFGCSLSAYRKYGKMGGLPFRVIFVVNLVDLRVEQIKYLNATWFAVRLWTNLHKASRAHRCRWSRELRSLLF